ncbi:DUF493 domain-containing protein [Marinobacteraceae bacterium S3BR75-40.1]
MTQPEAPKIEFPCHYPIKVIGDSDEGFEAFVTEVAQRHDPHLDTERVTVNPSRNGRFISIRLRIWATGEAQLQGLFLELKQDDRVHMVL